MTSLLGVAGPKFGSNALIGKQRVTVLFTFLMAAPAFAANSAEPARSAVVSAQGVNELTLQPANALPGETARPDPPAGVMQQPDVGSVGPAARVTREDADPEFLATNLLRENGIGTNGRRIVGVDRESGRTIVWIESRFAGLPVFGHRIGYTFGPGRRAVIDAATGEPAELGSELPGTNAFPIDHRPDIEPAAAIGLWLAAARAEPTLGADYQPGRDIDTTLGFYDIQQDANFGPVYRLAWRVNPASSRYPAAMIGAKKGDLLSFEAGPAAADEPTSIDAAGTGADDGSAAGRWIGGPCGDRRFARTLVLDADGTFTLSGAGGAVYTGTWSASRPRWISLEPDGVAARRADIPRDLQFDPARRVLHEATPGATPVCSYLPE